MKDDFFKAYVECALWASSDIDEQGSKSLADNYTTSQIRDKTLEKMEKDCDKFFTILEEKKLEPFPYQHDLRRAGHDFWLTRNGHGAGFRDGDWEENIAKELYEIAKSFGEFNLLVCDDRSISHFEG